MRLNFSRTILLGIMAIGLQSKAAFAQQLFFERVYDETLAQASYVIADSKTKEAIVIDPKRDVDTYLAIAKENGLKITSVTETHIHADFLSGARELAAATGATLYLSNEGGADWQYEFAHEGLYAGSKLNIGKIALEVLHTPGHTPESITFLLNDQTDAKAPAKAITGDFVFVGDVGRPDLLEKAAGEVGSQEFGAKQLFASINQFLQLPENTEIWPGHGAGSFCGKSLSNIPQSTIRQERLTNKALQFGADEAGFVQYILDGQPEPPKYFAVMKKLNKVERPLLVEVPKAVKLDARALEQARDRKLQVVDTRANTVVSEGFLPGSLHIEGGKMFSTFMGSLLDYQAQLVLIADAGKEEELTRKLMRIGMDNIYGFVSAEQLQGQNLQKSNRITIETFKSHLGAKDVQLVDVRTVAEYKDGHINGVQNIPLNSLEKNLDKISKDKPVVIHCQSGARSGIAYSILRKHGFTNILNYSGGVNDWKAKENPLVQ